MFFVINDFSLFMIGLTLSVAGDLLLSKLFGFVSTLR